MVQNTCLRRLCIGFSAILGLLGGIVIVLGAIAHANLNQVEKLEKDAFVGATVLCVFGTMALGVSLLGIYGAHKEKKKPLRMYFGILISGIILILCFTIQLVSVESKINEELEAEFKRIKTLNSASGEIQEAFAKVQAVFECCGYFGYQDWADEIPESCKCPSSHNSYVNSKCQTVKMDKNTYSYGFRPKYVEMQVYKEPCGPVLSHYMTSGLNAVLGLSCTFLVVMILSALLSIGLYLNIGQEDNTTAVSPEDPMQHFKFYKNDIITT